MERSSRDLESNHSDWWRICRLVHINLKLTRIPPFQLWTFEEKLHHCDTTELCLELNMDSIIVDEVVQHNRLQWMEEQLRDTYAGFMALLLQRLIPQKCFGCQVDHPSQMQHDVCLMMEPEEQVDTYFHEVLSMLNEELVLDFWHHLLTFELEPAAFHLEYIKYTCKDWRETTWKNEEWEEDIKARITDFLVIWPM